VHKLFTSCIRRCLVSRASTESYQRCVALLIFSFQFSLLIFFHIGRQAHQNFSVLLVLIRNIGHRSDRTLPKIWVGTFLVWNVHLMGKTELILMAKMESRHRVESQSGSEFRRSVIIAESWRPDVARRGNFVRIFCIF